MSAEHMSRLASRAIRKWSGLSEKVMSSLALEAIVQGLDNHHLLVMSQREFKRGKEGLDKVLQGPSKFLLALNVRILGARPYCLCPTQCPDSPVSVLSPPEPLNSTGDKLAENTICSPCFPTYEKSLAARILRDIKFLTRETEKSDGFQPHVFRLNLPLNSQCQAAILQQSCIIRNPEVPPALPFCSLELRASWVC